MIIYTFKPDTKTASTIFISDITQTRISLKVTNQLLRHFLTVHGIKHFYILIQTGYATNGTNSAELPMILTSVNCSGNETRIDQCSFKALNEGTPCNQRQTRAAVICSQYDGQYLVEVHIVC